MRIAAAPIRRAQPEPLGDLERRAAWLAASARRNAGRQPSRQPRPPVYGISDFGGGTRATARADSDLTGRFTRSIDQLGRVIARRFNAICRHARVEESAEKGRRWTFQDVARQPDQDLGRAWARVPQRL